MKPLQNDLLGKAIIIVGTPRSGTTFLGNVLKQHPALAYLEEPRLTWRYGNDDKSDMLQPDDARDEVCTHIRETFSQAVVTAGRSRLLEKTPSNSLRMAFIDRVLPNCKFIHIHRNGVDSVLSIYDYWNRHARGMKPNRITRRLRELDLRRTPYYLKEILRRTLPAGWSMGLSPPVWGPRIPGIDGLLRDLDLLEVCCIQWRMCVEAACQFGRSLPSDRYREYRLEDISPDVLRSLLEFAELSEADQVLQAFEQEYKPGVATARIDTATEEDIGRIRRWIEPTMYWLGYE